MDVPKAVKAMQISQKPVAWRRWFTVLPAIVAVLLPRLACPCQLPAYASLAGWLGLAFLLRTEYLFPLTAGLLTFAVGGLAVGARRRHGLGPCGLGVVAMILLLSGRFFTPFAPLTIMGLLVLLGASLWNAWPTRRKVRLTADGGLEPVHAKSIPR